MLISLDDKFIEKIISLGLILLYSIFYINLVIDDGVIWNLIYIPLILFLLSYTTHRILIFNKYLIVVCFSGFFFVTLNEFIFNTYPLSNARSPFEKDFNRIISHYVYILPLITLPTLFKISKFRMDTFFQICLLAIIISLAFNTYWNIFLDFERGRLAEKFNAIILYDYATICLSILTLIYGIQKKERISYIFITLSIVNIATLSLHGSRGTWIGIPVILIIIFIIYYKTHLNRLIAILFFSTLLTLISLIIPNSPILKRLNQFNQDTTNIQQNNFNTSTGQRLALWSFSIDEFKKSPITGVGMVQFQEDACELKDRKILPLCSHAHNIFLQELGTHGVLGITSLFLIFMTSILFFLKKQNFNKDSQLISTCGISLIVYSIFCGFTDYFFLSGPSTLFFFLTLISLMSFKITQNTKSN